MKGIKEINDVAHSGKLVSSQQLPCSSIRLWMMSPQERRPDKQRRSIFPVAGVLLSRLKKFFDFFRKRIIKNLLINKTFARMPFFVNLSPKWISRRVWAKGRKGWLCSTKDFEKKRKSFLAPSRPEKEHNRKETDLFEEPIQIHEFVLGRKKD